MSNENHPRKSIIIYKNLWFYFFFFTIMHLSLYSSHFIALIMLKFVSILKIAIFSVIFF